jgi:hypothetical protein
MDLVRSTKDTCCWTSQLRHSSDVMGAAADQGAAATASAPTPRTEAITSRQLRIVPPIEHPVHPA